MPATPRLPAASITASRCAGSSGPGSTTHASTTYVFVPSSVSGEGLFARTRTTPSGARSAWITGGMFPPVRVPAVATEVLARTALEQAAAVRSGEVSARELIESALAEIERLNPEINAFVTLAPDRAIAEADAIKPGDERPLAGVPIGIKDLGTMTEGIRTTFGSDATGDWIPPLDSEPVRRLRAAGAIVLGKTNTPECGPGRLRVGFTTRSPRGTDVDPACVEAAADAAELLESLGHEVEESEPEWGGDDFKVPFITVWSAQVAIGVERVGVMLGEPVPDSRLEPLT